MRIEKFKVVSNDDAPHPKIKDMFGGSITTKDKVYTITAKIYNHGTVDHTEYTFIGDDGKEYMYYSENFSPLHEHRDKQLCKIL